MTYSHTTSSTRTTTVAKYIASKVAADLQAMHAYYGQPSESKILDLQKELVELLPGGYVESIQYGFKRDGKKVIALKYEALSSDLLPDDKSGGVPARVDVSNATWFSFLIPSEKWYSLPDNEKRQIQARIPIKRGLGQEPGDGDGYEIPDKSYSSQGFSFQRRTFRSV